MYHLAARSSIPTIYGTGVFANGRGVEHHQSPRPFPPLSPQGSRQGFSTVTIRAKFRLSEPSLGSSFLPMLPRAASCRSPPILPSIVVGIVVVHRSPPAISCVFRPNSGQLPPSLAVLCRITITASPQSFIDHHRRLCHRSCRDCALAITSLLPFLY